MGLLDRNGNEGLNVNYYTSIDYNSVPGEAIFINSNPILTELTVSASGEDTARGDNAQHSGYLAELSSQKKGELNL